MVCTEPHEHDVKVTLIYSFFTISPNINLGTIPPTLRPRHSLPVYVTLCRYAALRMYNQILSGNPIYITKTMRAQ